MHIGVYPARTVPSGLVEAWLALQQEAPDLEHPLLHPAWMSLVGSVREDVHLAVVHRGAEAVAFFPFQRNGRHGYPVAGAMSDLHGLVAQKATEVDLRELLRACGLSIWHFDHVPVEQRWFAAYHVRVDEAFQIDLDGGFDAYWQERLATVRSWATQTQRKRRKLAREVGPPRFVWHTTEAPVLERLVEWKRRQLQRSHFVDVFSQSWFASLLGLLLQKQEVGFRGVLSALYAGPHLVAVHLGIANRRRLVSWIPTYNPSFAAYSPGTLIHWEMARHACSRGIATIELGRGANPLKRALASSTRRLAIGAVDLHPGRHGCRQRWHGFQDLVRAAPLGRLPVRAYRRMRNWMVPRMTTIVQDNSHAADDKREFVLHLAS